MRLLFDQNLSRRLLAMLRDAYPDSVHVVDVELDTATDREIWEYAGEHDLIVVSKDSDFRQLAFLYGAATEGRLASSRQRVDGADRNGAARPRGADRGLRG